MWYPNIIQIKVNSNKLFSIFVEPEEIIDFIELCFFQQRGEIRLSINFIHLKIMQQG